MSLAVPDSRLLDQRKAEYLTGLDDNVIACLGDHHPWPVLNPSDGLPARPAANGCFQVVVACPACGRVRTKTTLPGGLWDATAKWEYEGGPKPPPGLGSTRRDYAGELGRRITEALEGSSLVVEEGIPVVRFSG
jgi:hypothetical protein